MPAARFTGYVLLSEDCRAGNSRRAIHPLAAKVTANTPSTMPALVRKAFVIAHPPLKFLLREYSSKNSEAERSQIAATITAGSLRHDHQCKRKVLAS